MLSQYPDILIANLNILGHAGLLQDVEIRPAEDANLNILKQASMAESLMNKENQSIIPPPGRLRPWAFAPISALAPIKGGGSLG